MISKLMRPLYSVSRYIVLGYKARRVSNPSQEADDATRQMTREEYQRYSDCRQASFTYRKGLPPIRSFSAPTMFTPRS
jgi:hypothetical protein